MATLKHQVIDNISEDKLFTIDPITRLITNAGGKKQNLIQYDHNSERFTFVMPDEVEGHNMAACDSIQIHAVNTDSKTRQESKELYSVTDVEHDEANHTISFSWLISSRCTQYVGDLCFLVRCVCTGEDGDPIYIWNTAPCSTFKILAGINNSNFILEDYADVLLKWKAEIQALKFVDLKQTKTSTESGGENIWTAAFDDGTPEGFHRDLKVQNGAQGEPGKSAYKIAKDTGKTTAQTEEEWAQSLIPPEFYLDGVRLKYVKFSVSDDILTIETTT